MERLAAALADRYRIIREVGAGGMATVYLAEDLKHHREVALKVLRPELAATMGPERFFREIQVAARLQHPHILPLHDSGEAGGFLFFVMPFVPGESLRDRLGRIGELPVQDAVRILVQVADALSYSHSQGVVHRDIKPDNVMLSGRHALVTDFGVAKAVSESKGKDQVTTAGVALGTPTYMAPEQATADPMLDHRVDIYALGVVGYELLTGRTPFGGLSPQQTLVAHVTETPDPIRKYREACPPELEAVLMRCLAKRASDRWQSADELMAALEPFSASSGGMTPTQMRPAAESAATAAAIAAAPRRRTAIIAGVAGVAALALVVWGVSAGLTRGGANEAPLLVDLDRVQLTATGRAMVPALSPDGARLAFAEQVCSDDGICLADIRVQDVEGAGSTVVLRGALTGWTIDWSSDGRWLLVNGSLSDRWGAFAIPALGGAPRYLGCCGATMGSGTDTALVIGLVGDADSVFVVRKVSIADGTVRDSLIIGSALLNGPAFQMPGSDRLLTMRDDRSGPVALFLLRPDGSALDSIHVRVAMGTRAPVHPLDDGFLVMRASEGREDVADVLRFRLNGTDRIDPQPTVLARGLQAGEGAHLGRNGQLVLADGSPEYSVWSLTRDGLNTSRATQRQIARSTAPLIASVSPDGEHILLVRTRPNARRSSDVSLIPFGGGEETPLATMQDLFDWDWHQDSRSVAMYTRPPTGLAQVSDLEVATQQARPVTTVARNASWMETVAGGGFIHILGERQVQTHGLRARSDTTFTWPADVGFIAALEPAPDGRSVVSISWDRLGDELVLYHTSLIDGQSQRLAVFVGERVGAISWLPDGTLLVAIYENVWRETWYQVPVAGGTPVRIGDAPRPESTYRFARDGLRGVVRSRTALSDIYLIRNFSEAFQP